jgi:COX assembly protein 2
MHSDLSSHLHGPECNALIDALKKCHREHSFLKFVGHCNDINNAMLKCLRKEREVKRKKNFEKALDRKRIGQGLGPSSSGEDKSA